MKVLFVLDSLTCGGAEKSLVTLLSLIDYSKYDIDLLLFQRGGMFEEMVPQQVTILDGLEYARFTMASLNSVFSESVRTRDFKKLFARIKNSVRQRLSFKKVHSAQKFWESMGYLIDENPVQYDAAIAYSQGFPTYYVAEKVKAEKKFAMVNTDYLAAGYDRTHDFQFYNRYDTIVAVGENGKKIMQRTYPEFSKKIEVIYDILAPDVIGRMADAGRSYEDGYNGIRLLTIGRLSSPKGYDIAMEACRKLKDKGLKFRWYVLGEGSLRVQMEKYINKNELSENFVLLGARLNPYPYLKNCNIYVQTSKFEGFALTVAEARIFDKPIVTTNFDVVYEQINDGKNGLIVEMNADAVCKGILKLVEDEGLVKSMVECLKKEKKGNVEEFEKWQNLLGAGVRGSSL
jgi:glycosyltransferase involved in cell wall biosynthesis